MAEQKFSVKRKEFKELLECTHVVQSNKKNRFSFASVRLKKLKPITNISNTIKIEQDAKHY